MKIRERESEKKRSTLFVSICKIARSVCVFWRCLGKRRYSTDITLLIVMVITNNHTTGFNEKVMGAQENEKKKKKKKKDGKSKKEQPNCQPKVIRKRRRNQRNIPYVIWVKVGFMSDVPYLKKQFKTEIQICHSIL